MADRREESLTEELISVMDELNERQASGSRSVARIRTWHFTVRMSYVIKRAMDILLSLTALVVLLPLFLVLAVIITATSPGPVFFVQVRVGRYGRHVRFYKFRSMYIDAEKRKAELLKNNQSVDGVIFKMKKDPRCTGIGRILRRTSLDELPQFFNVLLGDMSLVGPRPPLPGEVCQYTLDQRKRLNVKPGITCLWQVQGRSDIPFREQVELDKAYMRSRSIRQDIWILLKTVPAIISGKGAY